MHPHRLALALALTAGCADDAATTPAPSAADLAFTSLPATTRVELVPTSPAVAARCATELAATWCSPTAALTAARQCRARLTAAERAACDPTRGCVAPYVPARATACVEGVTYSSPAMCSAPLADNCAFYRSCLEASHPCGEAGYALGFGELLCYLFIDHREEFTPDGQRWLREVRTCLQRSLAEISARPVMSCDALAGEAYASHTTCYTARDNSFCALPPPDVLRLASLLGPYLRDPRAMAQTRAVLASCSSTTP